jgi:hypothetical protein
MKQHELAPDPAVALHPLDLLLVGDSGAAGHSQTRSPDLQLCPACRGRFVVPGEVHEVVEQTLLRLELVCTACGWVGVGVHDDDELMELECHLDLSFADVMTLLETIHVANEEDQIRRFAAALEADAILPSDF